MKNNIFYLLCISLLIFPTATFASGISLSVSPTLFEMSATPSQNWKSSIKVINNNPHKLTVYAKVVNFAPQGETGQGKFLPVFKEFTEGKTLAEWINISSEAITIEQESSQRIPINIHVPEDAAPGGHFAAIMIGTRPLDSDESFQVKTAQIVTSLFFVRVAGDVIENGTVRTFRTANSFISKPEVDFEVRFENKGNVHLLPQGQIVITNMWGKKRGEIPINHQTHFGNVLPDSVRKFNFTWKGESSLQDIGRYKAVLTLAYGVDKRQFSSQATFFWIIPVKSVLLVLGTLLAILFLVTWSIKTYIRRMLSLAGVEQYVPPSHRRVQTGDVVVGHTPSVKEPFSNAFADFKTRLADTQAFVDTAKMCGNFVLNYRKFFASVLLLLLAGGLVVSFWKEVNVNGRNYDVIIENPDTPIVLSSEEIIDAKENQRPFSSSSSTQKFNLILVNSSDTPGVAAAMKKEIEPSGYQVLSLKSDFNTSQKRTVIVYDKLYQEQALQLSKILNGALLSAAPTSTNKGVITIYIGNDYSL